MPAWFYILRLKSGALYPGATHDLEKRTQEHVAGRGGRTTEIDRAIELVYSEKFSPYKEAFRREQQVKRWTRAKKEALIAGDFAGLKKLAKRKKP